MSLKERQKGNIGQSKKIKVGSIVQGLISKVKNDKLYSNVKKDIGRKNFCLFNKTISPEPKKHETNEEEAKLSGDQPRIEKYAFTAQNHKFL
jgi:hypothetical protein